MKKDKIVLVTCKVPETLRDTFVSACRGQDSTSAQELRRFMRQYVSKHGQKELKL